MNVPLYPKRPVPLVGKISNVGTVYMRKWNLHSTRGIGLTEIREYSRSVR